MSIRDVGDHVVVHTRNWGRGNASGISLEMPVTHVFTLRGRKIAE